MGKEQNSRTAAPETAFEGSEIAVIGMSCRFPGAGTIEEFWRNLRDGVESLTELSDEQLLAAGASPEEIRDPRYVRRVSVVDGVEDFDADFFGYTPLEATIMDPQHRLFLECAWEVLEQAGYGDTRRYPHPIGVFTGAKTNTYLFNVVAQRHRFPGLDNFQIALGNDLAAMATRVSYKLDLRGPSYALHTACSTSLVAVHLACQSLLLDECSMAVAGGAAFNMPQRRGYLYQEGGILSPDGSSRTFDAAAAGSNFGNGCGAVLLKRLEDALADGDPIWAVVRGSATNNDGAGKASFTAPGVEGQTAVLLEAMACAGIEARDISYVEAHGTATELGDSIEVLALDQAFRASLSRAGAGAYQCALGSAKTNFGHLETAAGIAGLIKTALALTHGELPPSLHFDRANPRLDLGGTPFDVVSERRPWAAGGTPRRAGVSSFGIGSTNAHVILEEAPPRPVSDAGEGWQLLLLSARSETALESMSGRLADHLERPSPWREGPHALADVAYTLALGRRRFAHRRAVLCRDREEAVEALTGAPDARLDRHDEGDDRPVAFLLPGLGDQDVGMGRELYRREPAFRASLDRSAELLRPELGLDLRDVLYPETETASAGGAEPDLRRLMGRGSTSAPPRDEELSEAERRLRRTEVAQPALFAVELALAELLREWGLVPGALLGYSLGEYVAACLAGVLSPPDALTLVARRARMIAASSPGLMLGVALPAAELEEAMAAVDPELCLAAVNAASLSVAAGGPEAVAELERMLGERGVAYRRLATDHAFHSRALEPLAGELTAVAKGLGLSPPEIPFVSNVSGTWITSEEATDPAYWGRHMCRPVRFEAGVAELLTDPSRVLLELGSGRSLTSFVKVHPGFRRDSVAAAVLGGAGGDDRAASLAALGQAWLAGVEVDWAGFYFPQRRLRVPLPTYPFERRRLWLDLEVSREDAGAPAEVRVALDKQEDPADWLYLPSWEEASPASSRPAGDGAWLVLGRGETLAEALRGLDHEVIEAPLAERPEDHQALLEDLRTRDLEIRHVVHLGASEIKSDRSDRSDRSDKSDKSDRSDRSDRSDTSQSSPTAYERSWNQDFLSLLYFAQAVGRTGLANPAAPLDLTVVTRGAYAVTGDEPLRPASALAVGPCRVIPQEFPGVACRNIDLDPGEADPAGVLLAELGGDEELIACRHGRRFARRFVRRPAAEPRAAGRLRRGGTYLLAGGLGGVGMALAGHLARRYQARLVLTGRSALPEPEAWPAWLEEHAEDDPVSARIRRLRELEALGAEVLAASVDVTDAAAMGALRDRALERFGSIDGVIHLAGVPGGGVIQLKTAAAARAIVDPKVRGALVLAEVLGELELDFVVLCSSIASILGEFGQADYCGANAFLDVFAGQWRRRGTFVTAVNWDVWQEVGLAVYTEVPDHLKAWRRQMLERGMLSAEGAEVLERVLAGDEPQVVISTQELEGRIELGKTFTGERFLREFAGGDTGAPAAAPKWTAGADLERRLDRIWRRTLGREEISRQENFFDLGGNSLIGLQLVSELNRELGTRLSPVELYEHPSIDALVRHLSPEAPAEPVRAAAPAGAAANDDDLIAVVGMAGRFPGARDVGELWRLLRAGESAFTVLGDEELLEAGVDPLLLNDPRFVRVGALLDDVDKFDAALFGYSPREAEIMDPQHRLFLECAWAALEDAGCDPRRYGGAIGVFGGASINTYLFRFRGAEAPDPLQLIIGNDKDALTTSVSYKLGLEGPSVGVQTFCSTSLVAVHMAARSLRAGECSMALAGGVTVALPQKSGYLFQEGSILSPEGCCRPFDAAADGTVSGSAVAIVVLKPLASALADGDWLHAVIRGSAINNDGSAKAGYTAPSVGRQADVVASALAAAGVSAETIGYVEAHGTGTPLGDPIEVTALTRAFRRTTDARGFCALGSVKGNVGHLDRAAGVTGLIKTVLALEHGEIPPSLHFERPNPKIDFESGPFFVNDRARPWPAGDRPRRAGVSSLGFGGTNAHVVLEEAPPAAEGEPSRDPQVLPLSGHTAEALDAVAGRLADSLEGSSRRLADVAFTLQVGRQELAHRRFVVAGDPAEAVGLLRDPAPEKSTFGIAPGTERRLVFLFPGQGSQYPGMGRELFDHEPVFRREIERAAEILAVHGIDLPRLLYPEDAGAREAGRELAQTRFTQPALFAVEHALARTWIEWGLEPEAMIGHSIGEYVAACLAGVFSFEDALGLVAERGRLVQELTGGDMLGVALDEEEVRALLEGTELSLAAVNAPQRLVISGPAPAVAAFAAELAAEGVEHRLLHTSHAFHSAALEPVMEPFSRRVAEIGRRPPHIPFISCLSGTWITDEQAVDPGYWAAQLRNAVRFSDGVRQLVTDEARVLLEVGPGSTLATLTRRHLEPGDGRAVVTSLPGPREREDAGRSLRRALGRLWLAGASPDWAAVHGGARRRRVPLPTYPFARRRCWVEEGPATSRDVVGRGGPREWLVSLAWKSSRVTRPKAMEERRETGWRLLGSGPLAETVAARARQRGIEVTVSGEALEPAAGVVIDLRYLTDPPPGAGGLLRLARRLDAGRRGNAAVELWVLTRGLQEVLGHETGGANGHAALPAVCRALGHGYPNLVCRHLDFFFAGDGAAEAERLADQVLAEVLAEPEELSVAYRGRRRWVPVAEPVELAADDPAVLPGGSYLVTGGLEDPGFSVAGGLSRAGAGRLVLLETEELPPRETWEELEGRTRPTAAEMSAFLAALAAERGVDADMAVLGAEIPVRLEALAGEVEREGVPEDFDALSDALCAAVCRRFIARGADVGAGAGHTFAELCRALDVGPRFTRFFRYLLHVLSRAEMVTLDGERVVFRDVPAAKADPESLGRRIRERYPVFRPGIDCLTHCAAHYPDVVSGAVDPVSVLFPGGDTEMLRGVMETQDRFSVTRLFRPLMVELIRKAAGELRHRPLRVLEFGAGDGNLTWDLAEALRGANVEYHFTDLGRAFVVAARKQAAERGLDFLRFGVLDITGDPEPQGFERYGFDVLVAFDVIHATARVRETVRNLKRLLAPGGWAMVLEPTRDQHWITMIWGLTEGWWLYADEELRSLHPLLAPDQWEGVLSDLGFSYHGVFPVDPGERAAVDHSLLVFQQPLDLKTGEYLEKAVDLWQARRRRAAERTRRFRELEHGGAEVELVTTGPGGLAAAVRQARERWGPPAGVIHAAGPWNDELGDGLDAETYERILREDDDMVGALESGLGGERPELALLVSPAAAAHGERPGPAAALDLAHAARSAQTNGGPPWRSLAWGVPIAGALPDGGGVPPELAAAALTGLAACPELSRVWVSERPDAVLAGTWNRLPAPRIDSGASPADAADEPTGEVARRLAAIWREVLGLDRVGLADNFFELGGDSLIATQIHARIREGLGIDMPMEKLFVLPTLDGQAREVEAARDAKEHREHEEVMAVLAEMSDEEAEQVLREMDPIGS